MQVAYRSFYVQIRSQVPGYTAGFRAYITLGSATPSPMLSDNSLPTWLHTLLCIVLGMPFALPLLFYGAKALSTRHLEPLSGPEFGQYFFGPDAVSGVPAQVAGIALVMYGFAFLSLSVAFTRHAEERVLLRRLPWVLLALGVGATFLVKH